MLDCTGQAETFVWECIEKRITKKYWFILKKNLTIAKEKILSKYRIGETCFTSIAVIGGKLFSNHPKNMNHVHKYTKYLLSVIITLGTNISGRNTVFNDRVKISDLGNRSHVLKYLHVIMVFGPFEKCFHEGTIWRVTRALISFILAKQIFAHFYHRGDWF